MLISLDNLAHRYGILPSEALARCSTFDFAVLDIGARWKNHQYEKQSTGDEPKTYSKDDLLTMWKNVKGDEPNANHKKHNSVRS